MVSMRSRNRLIAFLRGNFDLLAGDEQDYFVTDDWQDIEPFAYRAALA